MMKEPQFRKILTHTPSHKPKILVTGVFRNFHAVATSKPLDYCIKVYKKPYIHIKSVSNIFQSSQVTKSIQNSVIVDFHCLCNPNDSLPGINKGQAYLPLTIPDYNKTKRNDIKLNLTL
jgi:hypothetical protein